MAELSLLPKATDVRAPEGGDGDRYRLLIDAITDYAIFMLDLDGRIASWNSGAQRSSGYAASSASLATGEAFASNRS